ncbi:xylulokinase [Stappia sp.]|uniref:xylulokinase n=1 Tax=Stappia sp. TaxID=1870903 RepID=UPI003A9A3F9E
MRVGKDGSRDTDVRNAGSRAAGRSARDLLIAADFGTSGVKLAALDRSLSLKAVAMRAYPLSLPVSGQAEQAPADWWKALAEGIADLRGLIPDLAERTAALVFCAQMCGVVATDASGAPLRPAIVWLDKRAGTMSRQMNGGFPSLAGYRLDKLLAWTRIANGAPSHNGMDPPAKMLWLKQFEPDVFAGAHKLLDVKDWLLARATGRFVTTADSANLTWMMDTRQGREGWSPYLAGRLGIPLDKLPEIVDGTETVGGLLADAAVELGLEPGLPVIAGAGDVAATAIGSGAMADGELHAYAGTSAWLSGFFPSRRIDIFHSFATICSSVNYRPLLIATQESAGTAFAWAARLTGEAEGDTDSALARAYEGIGPVQADDPLFVPWLAGERVPVDDDRLRGVFYGLGMQHDRSALLRSVLEGVALNMRWALSKVAKQRGVLQDTPLPLVGGAAVNPLFAQGLADALKRPVEVRAPRLAGVRGAAAIAGTNLGWFDSVEAAAPVLSAGPTETYDPQDEGMALSDARSAMLERHRSRLIALYR